MYSVEVSNKLGDASGQAKVEIEPREKRPCFISDLHDTEVVEGFPVKFEIKGNLQNKKYIYIYYYIYNDQ